MHVAAWIKLDEYYARTDDSPAYATSVVLDPTWKWSYFQEFWSDKPDWITNAKGAVEALWAAEYRPKPAATPPPAPTPAPVLFEAVTNGSQRKINTFTAFTRRRPVAVLMDEYLQYLHEPVVPLDSLPEPGNPLSYWRQRAQQRRLPNLCRMALDLLSVPAMSADTERLFSQAKLTITSQRCKLQDSTVEMLQCIRSWDKSPLLRGEIQVSLLLY